MKILVVAPAWVGDMVMAQSLFRFLKSLHPKVRIDLVAPPSTAALAMKMPEVTTTHLLEVKHGGLQLRERFKLGCRLAKFEYDQAIVLPNSWKSALAVYFAKIPRRTGFLGEMRYGLLNDGRILDKIRYPLMVQRFCALALPRASELPSLLPWPKLTVDPNNQQKLIRQFNLNPTNALVICPGAEYGASKRWPAEYFAEVAKAYQQQGGEIWVVGGPKDQTITHAIEEKVRCKNLAGKTSLTDAVDLLALAKLVLTNDSGLMHIAAAVGVKVVALYGSTSPDFTPPLTDKAVIVSKNLPCRPCFARTCRFGHYHCLTQILPDEVFQLTQKQ